MKWLAGVIWFILFCIPATIILITTLETLHKLKLLYEYYLRFCSNYIGIWEPFNMGHYLTQTGYEETGSSKNVPPEAFLYQTEDAGK